MKIISNKDVAVLLPMVEAMKVVAEIMVKVSERTETLPLRSAIPVGGKNRLGVMPGAISDPACYGVKLLSLFPDNPLKGLSSHQGAVILFDADLGGAVAMMDADLLTAVRTAAASGVATQALARADAEILAIIAYGEQAEHHLDAMCVARPIKIVRIAGRSAEKAAEFAARASIKYPDITFTSGSDIQQAVSGADIICTVSASPTPLLKGAWITPGTHLNVVGSSIPTMREVDDQTVLDATIWVDYKPSTFAQAGEIVDMIAAGTITEDHIKGEIGDVLSSKIPGRTSAGEFTLYRSLGVAAQDLAAAHYILKKAEKTGLGQDVSF